jgi:hypothetical protein
MDRYNFNLENKKDDLREKEFKEENEEYKEIKRRRMRERTTTYLINTYSLKKKIGFSLCIILCLLSSCLQ